MLPCGRFSGVCDPVRLAVDLLSKVCRVSIFILLNGISVFWNWNTSKFVAACEFRVCHQLESHAQICTLFLQDINLPIFLLLFIGYKLWYKTKMVGITHGTGRRCTIDTFVPIDSPR